jgi:phosphate starvation-inducible protein PhoH and related proteins
VEAHRLSRRSIDLAPLADRLRLFGEYDRNLSAIEETLGVHVQTEDDRLVLSGDERSVVRAANAVTHMLDAAVEGTQITPHDVALAVADAEHREGGRAVGPTLLRTQRGREVRPRTAGQRSFVEAIEHHTLVLGTGPAGTGKTFLSVVMAVRSLRAREVARVILSRPAIEAGERLGFLPGDFREKLDPYMRPLYDALGEVLDDATVTKYLERGTIEVAPLAYMRGRTLSDAFVILDEGQNATPGQLKMFLTRLGGGSKMVVVGDVTQIDLVGAPSGMVDAVQRLAPVEDIAVVELDEADVVRHPLVARIVRAYARR